MIIYNNIGEVNNLFLKTQLLDIVFESGKLPKNDKSTLIKLLLESYLQLCKCALLNKKDTVKVCTRFYILLNYLNNIDNSIEKELIETVINLDIEMFLLFCEKICKKIKTNRVNNKIIEHLKSLHIVNLDDDERRYKLLIDLDNKNKKDYELKQAERYIKQAENNTSPFNSDSCYKQAYKIFMDNGEKQKARDVVNKVALLKIRLKNEFSNSNDVPPIPLPKEPLPKEVIFYLEHIGCIVYRCSNIIQIVHTIFKHIAFDEIKENDTSLLDYFTYVKYDINYNQTKNSNYSQTFQCQINASVCFLNYQVNIFLDELNKKFNITPQSLTFLFTNNIYFKDHYKILSKGVNAFFKQDYITAGSILIVQIEDYLRRRLQAKNINTTNLQTNGTQKENIDLSEIIEQCYNNLIINNIDYFWLKILLTNEQFNIRNNFAHGFYKDYDFNRVEIVVLLYWFIKHIHNTK